MKGQRKRAMWAKKRVENAEKRAEEKKANTARKPRKRRKFVDLKPRESRFVVTEEMARVASLPSASGSVIRKTSKAPKSVLTKEEYEQREALARAEIKRKSKNVAPMWNKGGYQYVGDAPPEIIKTLGRKV